MADIRINSLPSTATSFNTDDYIAIDGTSGGTRKMLAANPPFTDVTLGASGPSVKSTLSARAPRQGLVFDGTGYATGSVEAFAATDFSVFAWINVSSFASDRSIIGGGTGAFVFYVNTSGALVVGKYGSATLAVSTSTLTAGKNTLVGYVRSGTTGTYYINGVAAGTTSDSYNYTAGDSQIGANGGGSSIFLGIINPLYPYNRALSASEIVALYEAGAPSGADYRSPAAGTALITGADSNFSSDTGFWTKSGTAAITGGKAVLVNAGDYFVRNYILQVGQRYRATATISGYTGGTIWFTDANGNGVTATANGTYTADFVATSTSIYMGGPSAVASFDDVTLVPLGLLLAPDAAQAGGGLVWYDTSGNAANISWTSGVSWNVPSSRVLGGNWTTSGNLTVSGTSSLFGSGTASSYSNYTNLTLGGGSAGTNLDFKTSADARRAFIVWDSANNQYLLGTTGAANPVKLQVQDQTKLTVSNTAVTVADNLTVSGTGTSSVAGNFLVGTTIDAGYTITARATDASIAAMSADATAQVRLNAQSGLAILETVTNTPLRIRTNSTEAMRVFANGNVFIGASPVDSGNGKLQLATHTTSAGGIGFGTDISLFRSGSGTIRLSSTTAGAAFRLINSVGTTGLAIEFDNNTGYVWNYQNASLLFGTNNTTALTLDSSQNATFAGTALSTKATAFTSQTDLRNTVQFQASTTDAITRAGYLVRGATGNDDWYLLGDTQGSNPVFRIGKAASSTLTDLLTVNKNYGFIGTQGGTAYTPASASATGTAGSIAWDASYIYVCTAANTWKRVAIATW